MCEEAMDLEEECSTFCDQTSEVIYHVDENDIKLRLCSYLLDSINYIARLEKCNVDKIISFAMKGRATESPSQCLWSFCVSYFRIRATISIQVDEFSGNGSDSRDCRSILSESLDVLKRRCKNII